MQPKLIEDLQHSLYEEYQGNLGLFFEDLRHALIPQQHTLLSNDAPILITCRDVSKEYAVKKQKVTALSHIDFDIHRGEIVALVGPSGSGKSTLLHLLGGVDRPTSGTITVSDVALGSMRERDRATYRNKTVGFVFQFFHLQPYLSVLANVEIPLVFRGMTRHERRERALSALTAVSMESYIAHRPHQLSGGQQQRIAIARALVTEPSLILADEPTGNLDRDNARVVMEQLVKIHKEKGTTIIIVTHDLAVARYATRIITLDHGTMITTHI